MNPETDEQKGSCQNCGDALRFPKSMAGQTIACPHCGMKTALRVNADKPLMLDPDWQERLPTALQTPVKAMASIGQTIYGLFLLAMLGVFIFFGLRLLHAAWGH